MAASRIELAFAGTKAGFAEAFAALRSRLDDELLAAATRYRVELVFEEIVANVVRHGGRGGEVPSVAVAVELGGDDVLMTIDDDGPPFDPSQREEPVSPTSLEDAEIGGLGLMMVRRAASAVAYERTAGDRNRLTVRIPAGARS